MGLIKKLRKAKKEAPPNEKPAVVKTHLRDMIVVPEMIGSVVGIYNGKVGLPYFNSIYPISQINLVLRVDLLQSCDSDANADNVHTYVCVCRSSTPSRLSLK